MPHIGNSNISAEKTKPTRVQSIESTTVKTSIKNEKEEPREEYIQEPMLTDKMGMSIEVHFLSSQSKR